MNFFLYIDQFGLEIHQLQNCYKLLQKKRKEMGDTSLELAVQKN